jgi:hypothetical protein
MSAQILLATFTLLCVCWDPPSVRTQLLLLPLVPPRSYGMPISRNLRNPANLYSLVIFRKSQSFEWLSTAHYNPVDDKIYGSNHIYNFAHNTSLSYSFSHLSTSFVNLITVGNGTEWSLYASTLDILSYPWDPRGNTNVSPGSARIHYIGGVCYFAFLLSFFFFISYFLISSKNSCR